MSYLLRDPLTVLLVGLPPNRANQISELIVSGAANDVVESAPADAGDAVAIDDDVGCVVIGSGVDPGDAAQICTDVRNGDPLVPILLYVNALGDVPGELATVNNCRVLPVSTPDEQFLAAVDDALDTYERQRRHRAESSMLTTMLDRAEVPMYVKDTDARHLRLADVKYGYDPEESKGKTDLEVMGEDTPEMAQKTYEDDLKLLETEEPVYDQDEKFEQEDFTYWSRTNKVPWYDYDGELRGLLGISRDVTELKKRGEDLEEQRQLNEQFTNYVSHDLRTPLQVASGALELARETGDEDAFEKVETTLTRMEETIQDLTELANQKVEAAELRNDDVEAGEDAEDELAELDDDATVSTPRLATVVSDVWDVVGREEATLRLDFHEETTITVDEEALRPLLENLLKNAQVHAGPEVTITVGLTESCGFYVADDGPGIPEDEREAVLEAGYTTAEGGTGTGLHIVSEVAEENGWELRITESAAGGARIEVNDCLLVADPPGIIPPGESEPIDADLSIGDVAVEGTADYVESVDRWIVTGAGQNIWGDANEFHFAYAEGTPPLRIQGKIANLDPTDQYSKTGLMIRSDLEEDGPFAFVGQTAADGSEVIWRMGRDEPSESAQMGEPDSVYDWYRIEYVDETLTCSLSEDGGNWTPVDQRELDLGEEVLAGLVVCSHDDRVTSTGEFEGVTVNRLEVD